jgi:hypothetical protein
MNTTRNEKSQFVVDLMEALGVSRLSEEEAVALKDLAESAIDGSLVDETLEIDGCEYRLISDKAIDGIMADELASDEYILGCFAAWFIADITGLDCAMVERAQEAENFELLGALMAQKIDEVVEKYANTDGYAHHFATYDGDEREVQAGEDMIYIFRTN